MKGSFEATEKKAESIIEKMKDSTDAFPKLIPIWLEETRKAFADIENKFGKVKDHWQQACTYYNFKSSDSKAQESPYFF